MRRRDRRLSRLCHDLAPVHVTSGPTYKTQRPKGTNREMFQRGRYRTSRSVSASPLQETDVGQTLEKSGARFSFVTLDLSPPWSLVSGRVECRLVSGIVDPGKRSKGSLVKRMRHRKTRPSLDQNKRRDRGTISTV